LSSDAHGGGKQLVKMANDIGHFFVGETVREDAIAGMVNHIGKFWTKRMLIKIADYLEHDGDGELEELPREALRRLLGTPAARPAAE
jgi:formate dehydrogenase subunit delta